jgi:predicted DNA-binding transcriptional regulator YafY
VRVRVRVRVRFDAWRRGDAPQVREAIAERIEDLPIAADQRVGAASDGWCPLEASVPDSMELRGWLRSLGPLIEVLSPSALRLAMIQDVAELQGMYSR